MKNKKVIIYLLQNNKNNKVYVGQTTQKLENRFRAHLSLLARGVHFNELLQEDYNKYGKKVFSSSVLEFCIPSDGNDRERYWISYFGGNKSLHVYNITEGGQDTAPNKDVPMSEEQKNKMIGRTFSEEHRKNLSNSLKGREAWNKGKPGTMLGKKLTEEQREKIRQSNIRRWQKWREENDETPES